MYDTGVLEMATSTQERQLLKALERLASTEAFTLSRTIDPVRDAEFLARIDFARNELEKFKA